MLKRVAAALMGCLMLWSCASLRETEIRNTEDLLAAAGFIMKPADTPERMANLQSLPPHRIVTQRRNGDVYYVYADPDVCRCVWVGNQQAYSSFQKLRIEKQIAEQRLLAAEAERDALLNWPLWGPWPWWR
jgi:hypothetical protein